MGNVHVKPGGVETDEERATEPERPFREVTVIVEVPGEPVRIWIGVEGPAVMLKSPTWKRMVEVVWDRVPLAAVTETA